MPYYYLTPTGATTKTGLSRAAAFDWAAFVSQATGAGFAAGDVLVWQGGAYTMTGDVSVVGSGTAEEVITIIPVKAATTHEGADIVESDYSTVADRPIVDGGSYAFYVLNYWRIVSTFKITSDSAYGLRLGQYCYVNSVDAHNDEASTGTQYGIYCLLYCYLENCVSLCDSGRGISAAGGSHVINCKSTALDATNGLAFYPTSTNTQFIGCIAIGQVGVYLGNIDTYGYVIKNCTFYGCVYAVYATGSHSSIFSNNIIQNCTNGFYWIVPQSSNVFIGNHQGASVTDMWFGVPEAGVGPYADQYATTGDVLFANAPTDLSLLGGSPCWGTAKDISVGV